MSSKCKLYSNNPDPEHLVLYFDRDLKEVFRVEFSISDPNKVFEKKYELVCHCIQTTAPVVWEKLDMKKNFRKTLRSCQWVETIEALC